MRVLIDVPDINQCPKHGITLNQCCGLREKVGTWEEGITPKEVEENVQD